MIQFFRFFFSFLRRSKNATAMRLLLHYGAGGSGEGGSPPKRVVFFGGVAGAKQPLVLLKPIKSAATGRH